MISTIYSKYFIIISVFLATVFSALFLQTVESKELDSHPVEAVKFYPNKTITLSSTDHHVISAVSDILLTRAKTSILKLTANEPRTLSDYILDIDYAVGCGAYRPEKYCRVMFLWTLMRADGAPVSGWRADYPVSVSQEDALNRFYNYKPSSEILKKATNDFIQALSNIMIENSSKNLSKSKAVARSRQNIKKSADSKKGKPRNISYIYVQKDQVSHPKALCSVRATKASLRRYEILTTNNLKKADFILKTKTDIQDVGAGFIGVRILRQVIDVKTGKGIMIPQETAMRKKQFEKNGINCKSAIDTSIKQIKEYIR